MHRIHLLALCPLFVATACSFLSPEDETDHGGGGSTGLTSGTGGDLGTSVGGGPLGPPNESGAPNERADCQPSSVTYYLSADDSNSMASPALARERIRDGVGAPMDVRTHEFLNYYRIASYPQPNEGLLSLRAHLRGANPEEQSELFFQFAIQSGWVPPRQKILTLVIDTSASMGGEPLERARAVMKAIANSLNLGDVIHAVKWSEEQSSVLPTDSLVINGPDDRQTVIDAADALEADGATDFAAGLNHGYDLAQAAYDAGALNRVVLISDGGATLGDSEAARIAEEAADGSPDDIRSDGIYLVGVGVGPQESYHDTLMDVVTDAGKGAYVYIDDYLHPDGSTEAETLFGERFEEVMEVAALDVQVELTLPGYLSIAEFSGEVRSSSGGSVEPQNLAPNDAMVFFHVLSDCRDEPTWGEETIKVLVKYKHLNGQMAQSLATYPVAELLAKPDKTELEKTKAVVDYAEALRSAHPAALDAAHEAALAAGFADDPNLAEIPQLLEMHLLYPGP